MCAPAARVWLVDPSILLADTCQAQGFAERKLHLLHDILSNCHNYHQQAKRRERLASIRPLQVSPYDPTTHVSSEASRQRDTSITARAPGSFAALLISAGLQARSIQQSTSWGTPPGTGTAEQSSQLPQQRPEQQQQQHRRSLAGRRDQLTASHSFSISVEEHQQDDPFNAPSCSKPAQPLSSTGLGPEADAKAALDRSSSSAAAAAASQPSCAPGRKKQAKQTQRRCLQSPASTRSKLQTHVPPAEQPCPNSEQGQAPCKSQPHHARPEGSAHALDHSRPRLPTPQEACACCGTPALTSAAAQVSSPDGLHLALSLPGLISRTVTDRHMQIETGQAALAGLLLSDTVTAHHHQAAPSEQALHAPQPEPVFVDGHSSPEAWVACWFAGYTRGCRARGRAA